MNITISELLALIAFLLGSDTWLDAELLLLDYPHLTCQHKPRTPRDGISRHAQFGPEFNLACLP